MEPQVLEDDADVSLLIPLAERLLNRFGEDPIGSISFEKGFYKREGKGLKAFKRHCAPGVLVAKLHKLGNVLQERARKKGRLLQAQNYSGTFQKKCVSVQTPFTAASSLIIGNSLVF